MYPWKRPYLSHLRETGQEDDEPSGDVRFRLHLESLKISRMLKNSSGPGKKVDYYPSIK